MAIIPDVNNLADVHIVDTQAGFLIPFALSVFLLTLKTFEWPEIE